MKKHITLTLAFLILSIINLNTVSAQITIKIPKFPKIKKPIIEQSNQQKEQTSQNDFSPEDVKENPNAPKDFDANLQSGTMAIGVGEGGSPYTIKIVSKSGGIYKTTYEESPNKNIMYFKANSVYPYFDSDMLLGLVNEYRAALEPYVDCYAAKHDVPFENLKGNGFGYNIGWYSEKELKTRLEKELPKLAELETKLQSKINAFPDTFVEYANNPAVVREIAVQRNEYFQCVTGKKNSLKFEESVWLMAHRDGINKVLKSVEAYDPATEISMNSDSEYAFYAVSPKMRDKWLTDKQALDFKEPVDALLKPLAAALAKKLPTFFPKPERFAFHSPAEETMMKRVLTNPARYKIFKSGLMQGVWQIDKNSLGIPNARYKNGLIYLRDTQSDHPYCFATYVNIIQDYAGGGRYAASRAKFIQDELVGCPSGAK